MSVGKVLSDLSIQRLDTPREPDALITEEDVQNPRKMALLLTRIVKEIAEVKRRFVAKRIDYEDVTVTNAGLSYAFQHSMKGRVRWWPVGWQSASADACVLVEDTARTDDNTLYLKSYGDGVVTLRVESAG